MFAKHFKVQDQIDLLSKQYFPVAVGTPNRLAKLVELGALSLSRVKVISQFLVCAIPYVFCNLILGCLFYHIACNSLGVTGGYGGG